MPGWIELFCLISTPPTHIRWSGLRRTHTFEKKITHSLCRTALQCRGWFCVAHHSLASFYTRALPKIKDNLTITVNDSLQLKMPVTAWPLPVALPGNVPSKVCFAYDGKSSCRIIAPTPFAANYYELDFSSNEKSFDIEKRSLNQFKTYLSYYVKK
jgi:hypothetical protein